MRVAGLATRYVPLRSLTRNNGPSAHTTTPGPQSGCVTHVPRFTGTSYSTATSEMLMAVSTSRPELGVSCWWSHAGASGGVPPAQPQPPDAGGAGQTDRHPPWRERDVERRPPGSCGSRGDKPTRTEPAGVSVTPRQDGKQTSRGGENNQRDRHQTSVQRRVEHSPPTDRRDNSEAGRRGEPSRAHRAASTRAATSRHPADS